MKIYFLSGISILLSLNTNAQAITTTKEQQAIQSFKEIVQAGNNYSVGSEGSPLISVKVSEGTKGSPYLLTNWTPGKVMLRSGNVYLESTPVLNFDKIKQVLVLKLSATRVFEVDMNTVMGFELADSGRLYKFVSLDTKPATQVMELYKDSSNTLYKSVHTEFFKADYVDKGYGESGEKYDRYIDNPAYYIRNKLGQLIKINNVTSKKIRQLESEMPGISEALKNTNVPAENKDLLLAEVLRNLAK